MRIMLYYYYYYQTFNDRRQNRYHFNKIVKYIALLGIFAELLLAILISCHFVTPGIQGLVTHHPLGPHGGRIV